MRYSDIIYFDSGNARGLSTVLFVQGCTNNCAGCHNPQTHSFSGGKEFNREIKDKIIDSVKKPYIKNFILSGGDPLHSYNQEECNNIIKEVKAARQNINIIVYTGYTITEDFIKDNTIVKEILSNVDYIIDGKYDRNLPTEQLDYRGSTNQRAICRKNSNNKNILIDCSKKYFKFPVDSDEENKIVAII